MIWREPPASDLQKTRGFVYRALIRPLRRALTESDRCQREFYVSSSTSDVRFSPFLSKRWHISAAEGLRNEIILLLYGINVFNLLGSSCWGGTPSLEQPWDGGGPDWINGDATDVFFILRWVFFAHDISRLTQTSSRYRYASFTQSSGCVLYHPKRLALARAIIHQVVNRNCGKANPAPCFSCGTVSEAMIR